MNSYLVPLGRALGEPVAIADLPGLSEEQVANYHANGFRHCRVARQNVFELCYDSLRDSTGFKLAREAVDLLTYAIDPAVPHSNNNMVNDLPWQQPDIRWLLQRTELRPARVLGLALYNCASFIGAVDLSLGLMRGGLVSTSLNIVGGAATNDAPRVPHERQVHSDGAVSFLVTDDPAHDAKYRILAHRISYVNPAEFRDLQGVVDKTRYYNLKAIRLRNLAREALAAADVSAGEIDHFFLQNLGRSRMAKNAGLCGVPEESVWLGSLAANAHVVGADSPINFQECHDSGLIADGSAVMLIGTSGMSWGALILRREDQRG